MSESLQPQRELPHGYEPVDIKDSTAGAALSIEETQMRKDGWVCVRWTAGNENTQIDQRTLERNGLKVILAGDELTGFRVWCKAE